MLSQFRETLRRMKGYSKLLRLKKIPFYLRDRILIGRKNAPSKFCVLPWTESAVLCDGTVVCGCFDALAMMPLGNIDKDTFTDIWYGKRYQRLRKGVREGAEHMFLCSTCFFSCSQPSQDKLDSDFPLQPSHLPRKLHIEPTVRCNLRCIACNNAFIRRSRNTTDMQFDMYKRLLDEVGLHLRELNFYDYGESFMHAQAIDMIRYAKSVNPAIQIVCSTNGHFFRTPQRRSEIVTSGVDRIIFSVDGASQETYEKYRVGGCFDIPLDAMEGLVKEKHRLGLDKPEIIWRYILFRWNDSDMEMDQARALARKTGVDELRWMLTNTPPDGRSLRFTIDSPEMEKLKNDFVDYQV